MPNSSFHPAVRSFWVDKTNFGVQVCGNQWEGLHLQRWLAQVPSRSSKSEFIDENEGEGAELSGRLSLTDTGRGHGDEDAETWDWEQRANSSLKR